MFDSDVSDLWLGRARALVVPPRCAACGRACAAQSILCEPCLDELAAMPVGAISRSRLAAPDPFARRFAAFPYEGAALRAVQALKFRGATSLAPAMALLIAERLPPDFVDDCWIVPAPANPARRRSRGYNQAALIAAELGAQTGAPVFDCLVRAPGNRPQSELSRAERLALPRGSIAVGERVLRQTGRNPLLQFPTNVLVCDDVTTTGCTLEVCASAICERYPQNCFQFRAVTFASTSATTPATTAGSRLRQTGLVS